VSNRLPSSDSPLLVLKIGLNLRSACGWGLSFGPGEVGGGRRGSVRPSKNMKKTERQVGRPFSGRRMPIRERAIEGEPATSGTTRSVEKSRADQSGGEPLSLAEIRDLIELISEKQFNEFELEHGGFRLRLQKGTPRSGSEAERREETAAMPVPVAPTAISSTVSSGGANTPAAAASVATQEEHLHVITSPIVGTFYRSPSPTSQAFVQPGDVVEIGRTVCIIEAMKLMNEIESDTSGKIVEILVDNAQPVEYGQVLMRVEPN